MLPIDTLVHISLATLSLGTIHEEDGIQRGDFWLRNDGTETVELKQGYTSCGCVKLDFNLGESVAPGDSTLAVLTFDPKGKGGEFYERGTIVYGEKRKRIDFALEGDCISSEETLLRQYPIRVTDDVRLSANHFDLGMMSVGERKSRNVSVIHRDDNNRKETFTIELTVDKSMPKGIRKIEKTVSVVTRQGKIAVPVTFSLKVI